MIYYSPNNPTKQNGLKPYQTKAVMPNSSMAAHENGVSRSFIALSRVSFP